jgi:hypothetical protein
MKLNKKIMVIIILTLLIGTVVPAFGITENQNSNNFNLYELDQQSTKSDKVYAIGPSDRELAQSFTPTLPILTKVILRLKSTGIPEFYYYYVDIKSSYLGSALTTAFIHRDTLVIGTNSCEFDFPDISVNPGTKYYIILRGVSDSSDSSKVWWWYGYPDPYTGGDAWYEYEGISGWNYLKEGIEYCDFWFQTYGTSVTNQPPNNPASSYDRLTDELVVTTTDPDEDQVRYGIDWNDDMSIDQWTSLVPSGTEQRIDCGSRKGNVGVIAEDEYGAQSSWVSQKSKNKQDFHSGSFIGEIGIRNENEPLVEFNGRFRDFRIGHILTGEISLIDTERSTSFQGFITRNYFIIQSAIRNRIVNIVGKFTSFNEEEQIFSGIWRGFAYGIGSTRGWITASFIQ